MFEVGRFRLRDFAADCLLAHPEQRFTARQIAEWILAHHPEACESKRQASKQDLSSDSALLQQIVAEIGANRSVIERHIARLAPGGRMMRTEERPGRYFFAPATAIRPVSDEGDSPSEAQALSLPARPRQLEAGLYPLLAEYLAAEFGLKAMRIDERRSRNTRGGGGNEWLFPDLVALEPMSRHWHPDLREAARAAMARRARLWSFEVKLSLSLGDVRRSYFQAVSNSAWANFGYLVAAEIPDSAAVTKELRLLAGQHGIGVVRLDAADPAQSYILIPATERLQVDWDAADRIAQENADFLDFIERVGRYHREDKVQDRDWPTLPRQ